MADPVVVERPAGFRATPRAAPLDPAAERLKATVLNLGEPGRSAGPARRAREGVEVALGDGYAVRGNPSGPIEVIGPEGNSESVDAAAARLKLPGLREIASRLLAGGDAAIAARELAALPATDAAAPPRLPSGASDAMGVALGAAHRAVVAGQALPVMKDGVAALVLPGGGALVQHGGDVFLYASPKAAPFDVSIEAAIGGITSAAGVLLAAARPLWPTDAAASSARALETFGALQRSSMFLRPRAAE